MKRSRYSLHQNGDQILLGREVVVHAGLGDRPLWARSA